MKRALASGKFRPKKHVHKTTVTTTHTYTEEYPIYVEVPVRVSRTVIRQPSQKISKQCRQPVAKRTKVRYNILVKFKSFTDQIHKKRQERKRKMANKKFLAAQVRAEVLGDLYDTIQDKIKDVKQSYQMIKKDAHQKKDWKTGEYLWEDEEQTIPVMEDEWGYVTKKDNELTEEEKLRISVLTDVGKSLEKLL